MTPYLIQRFKAPPKKIGSPLDNAHRVFGGGMMQLSKEAWDLLDEVFTVDYMGAAEFEFGALPKCISRIIQAKNLYVRGTIEVLGENPNREWKKRRNQKLSKPQPKVLSFFCQHKDVNAVIRLIPKLAKGEFGCKEDPRFAQALDPLEEWDSSVKAWLDIENDYFFSLDSEMFSKFADMLEINGTV